MRQSLQGRCSFERRARDEPARGAGRAPLRTVDARATLRALGRRRRSGRHAQRKGMAPDTRVWRRSPLAAGARGRYGSRMPGLASAGCAPLLIGLLLAAAPVPAADFPKPAERDFVVKGFAFRSGETLPDLRLHYRTLGTPRRDSR